MKLWKVLLPIVIIAMLFVAGFGIASAAFVLPRVAASVQNQANALTSSSAPAAVAQQAPVAQATAVPLTNTADPVTTGPAVAALQGTLENVYAQVNPSVVNIEVTSTASTAGTQSSPFGNSPFGNSPFGNNPFGNGSQQAPVQQALGSGFVWDMQGHIVTNNHVVAGATQITVTFADGTTASAKVVGTDLNSDLAVIQVNVPSSELHPVTLMNSSQVKVGQLAIAIGNPYGLNGTMTTGIISGLSRSLPVGLDNSTQTGPTYSIPDIIQTDASINPGNSGGVLVNDQGQLMGVTAAIRSASGANAGIGFVIPSNIVNKVVPSLIQTGSYSHPYIGISGTTLTPDLAQQMNLPINTHGVLVATVTPGGPAAQAGLQGGNQTTGLGGDVITAINGQSIQRFEDLSSYLFNNTKVGQTVNLTILRNGQQQTVQLTLQALPQQ